jgi:hypothetical protein
VSGRCLHTPAYGSCRDRSTLQAGQSTLWSCQQRTITLIPHHSDPGT